MTIYDKAQGKRTGLDQMEYQFASLLGPSQYLVWLQIYEASTLCG